MEDDDLGVDLTGFLFGNIDSKGQLENDDIFDGATKRQLNSLSQFGITSVRELVGHGSDEDDADDDDSDEDDNTDGHLSSNKFNGKADDAIDYSDINELAEETVPPESSSESSAGEVDIETRLPAVKLQLGDSQETLRNDQDLMPPPLVPCKSLTLSPLDIAKATAKSEEARRLETPLAAILPSKYANVDVRELFPDFRPDKILHFSRLFGPGKPSSLPQIWRSVKNRRKKRKPTSETKTDAQSDSTSDTDDVKPFRGWNFNYAPDPTPDLCVSDDEEKFLRDGPDESENNDNDTDEKKPKVADWRYGPAQVWYDLLDVPESGEGFNYGFKMKEEKVSNEMPFLRDIRI